MLLISMYAMAATATLHQRSAETWVERLMNRCLGGKRPGFDEFSNVQCFPKQLTCPFKPENHGTCVDVYV